MFSHRLFFTCTMDGFVVSIIIKHTSFSHRLFLTCTMRFRTGQSMSSTTLVQSQFVSHMHNGRVCTCRSREEHDNLSTPKPWCLSPSQPNVKKVDCSHPWICLIFLQTPRDSSFLLRAGSKGSSSNRNSSNNSSSREFSMSSSYLEGAKE